MRLSGQGRISTTTLHTWSKGWTDTTLALRLSSRTNRRTTLSLLAWGGMRPGNGIQRDMKGNVESQIDTPDWIGRRCCYAWASRDPRSKLRVMRVKNSVLCISYILSGRIMNWAKKESGPNYTISAHAFVKAILRLGMLASFVAHNKRLKSRNRSNVSEKVNTWLHGNVLHDKAGYTCDTLKKFAHAR